MNEKKWCLLKVSDGSRGANGKRKMYEIIVKGSTVEFRWGMAEKSSRQSSKLETISHQHALYQAKLKLWEKVGSGYEVAYEV